MARCKARLIIEAENSGIIARAIAADNLDYVRTAVEGRRVITTVDAPTVGSMLATLDDLMVNLKVADDLLGGHGIVEGQED